MTSLMSKRQQARNEKALQDLVHSVPGNKTCADCYTRNPAWASWSLGIFLCMRCATIHRKLGTHISKVKSLSMDGWTNEQVENMKRVGNIASNKIYNVDNKQPPVPIDADEADSAMERFIRAKYTPSTRAGTTAGRSERRSVESDEGTPPPLPPKTGGKFFSKKSSAFPLSFRSKKTAHYHDSQSHTPELRNKPSKVFGASVHDDNGDDTAQKLVQLRDMGFTDDKRNAMVLKGVGGNLEKTIETLVRLGERGLTSPSLTSPRGSSLNAPNTFSTPRSLSPAPPTPTTAGLSVSRPSPTASHSPAPSNNPWDISPAQPQSSQSTGNLQNKNNPFYASTNPFGMPNQPIEYNLNQSLQNLSLAPAQQPLFPHHTGGLPAPHPVEQPVYQQPMTPPIPQSSNFSSVAFNGNQMYPQAFQPQPTHAYNPFLQQSTAQQPLSVNTFTIQNQGGFANNPFTKSPTRIASPTLSQIPEQSQQNFYGTPASPNGSNPFYAMGQPVQSAPAIYQQAQPLDQTFYQSQMQQQQQQQQQQQLQLQQQQQPMPPVQPAYQPQQRDKASIMALYSYPSMASISQQQPQMQHQDAQAGVVNHQQVPQQMAPNSPQRSVSTPLPGNKNPFLYGSSPQPAAPVGPAITAGNMSPFGGARSRESVSLGLEMAWNNGRHSPDAFAGLSARGA